MSKKSYRRDNNESDTEDGVKPSKKDLQKDRERKRTKNLGNVIRSRDIDKLMDYYEED